MGSAMPVNRVDPTATASGFSTGSMSRLNNDCFLVATDNHALQRVLRQRIYFLMRHVGRNVNVVSRPSLRGVFQMFAPAHAGAPAYERK